MKTLVVTEVGRNFSTVMNGVKAEQFRGRGSFLVLPPQSDRVKPSQT